MLASITHFNRAYETPITSSSRFQPLNPSPIDRQTIPFYNINYDYFPTVGDARQTLWVETALPPPLEKGGYVRIYINGGQVTNEVFRILDVVGTRVVLEPFQQSYYHETPRTKVSWGRSTIVPRLSKNWIFGDGSPRGYLVPL